MIYYLNWDRPGMPLWQSRVFHTCSLNVKVRHKLIKSLILSATRNRLLVIYSISQYTTIYDSVTMTVPTNQMMIYYLNWDRPGMPLLQSRVFHTCTLNVKGKDQLRKSLFYRRHTIGYSSHITYHNIQLYMIVSQWLYRQTKCHFATWIGLGLACHYCNRVYFTPVH